MKYINPLGSEARIPDKMADMKQHGPIVPDMTRKRKALELWQEWFDTSDGNPYIYNEDGNDSCFFCESDITDGCTDNCIYIRAKELIE